MKEIGSEFSHIDWSIHERALYHSFESGTLVFSGRTAIETVLKNEPSIKKVMLPSYCCDSMIGPFRRAEIEVCFYQVCYSDGLQITLKIPEDVDCLLWCNYFGFRNEMPDVSKFVDRGGIIIEDITHSLYSVKKYHPKSHYLVASIRKWEPVICGGYCASLKKEMKIVPNVYPPVEFLEQKKTAMQMKARYLDGDGSVSKNAYLQMFSQSNHWLAEHYSGLTIDQYSLDYLRNVNHKAHSEVRKRNAEILYEELKDSSNIRFLFDVSKMDCPLFVPIVIEKGKRDAVRRNLIERQIYCPVHWPKPNADCESNLYDMELSLICDHRYNAEDMRRIASVLNNV